MNVQDLGQCLTHYKHHVHGIMMLTWDRHLPVDRHALQSVCCRQARSFVILSAGPCRGEPLNECGARRRGAAPWRSQSSLSHLSPLLYRQLSGWTGPLQVAGMWPVWLGWPLGSPTLFFFIVGDCGVLQPIESQGQFGDRGLAVVLRYPF